MKITINGKRYAIQPVYSQVCFSRETLDFVKTVDIDAFADTDNAKAISLEMLKGKAIETDIINDEAGSVYYRAKAYVLFPDNDE